MMQELDAAVAAAKQAGALLRRRLNSNLIVENKAAYDFVTNADRESEALIYGKLHEAFPAYRFYGEEEISGGGVCEDVYLDAIGSDTGLWVVDALDGTTNYIHGVPQCVISIALAKGGDILLGVIYDPWHDDIYTAEAGKGAFLNGESIHVSQTAALEQIMFSTSFPAADMDARRYMTGTIHQMGGQVMSLRVYNCAALALAYTACGHLDAHFELGLHLWDMAAGVVLVREAGGVVTNGYGEPFTLHDRDILAAGSSAHAALKGLLCKKR